MTTPKKSSHPIPRKLSAYIKFLSVFAPQKANKIALKLFFTPQKFSTPEREQGYKSSAVISREIVNNKQITLYQTGLSQRKVLLVHGWSGRATQFYEIAPALNQAGFKVYAFTAPAHGSSKDDQTHLLEIAECIQQLDSLYGPFEAVLGHSLGATAILNAINKGIITKKVVAIGASGYITEVVEDFCKKVGFNKKVTSFLLNYLRKNYSEDFEQFSFTRLAEGMLLPCLLIHDENDLDVAFSNALQNHKAWKNSELLETKGLGHRLILSDKSVINRIITFLD